VVGIHREGVGAGLPAFLTGDSLAEKSTHTLDEHTARHMRVLRLEVGAAVSLRDGHGAIAVGQLVRLTKSQAQIDVREIVHIQPLSPVHLLVPVADKDRMLWLAEKGCELACTSWRPVMWRRSRSVSPRGEGAGFQQKVAARMALALAQSEGAWMPQLFPEANVERAMLAAPMGIRVILDPHGPPLTAVLGNASMARPAAEGEACPVTLAIGPEGGIETDEMALLHQAGFVPASIGSTILRFETAAIAALAIARTVLAHDPGTIPSFLEEGVPRE